MTWHAQLSVQKQSTFLLLLFFQPIRKTIFDTAIYIPVINSVNTVDKKELFCTFQLKTEE
jgi:hypothetical protein